MIIAFFGTSSKFKNNLQLSLIVCPSKSVMCVNDSTSVKGSLKAICPFVPIPKS